MKMAKITHKSLVDWDFSAGTEKALDSTIFVSPPSSLRIYSTIYASNLRNVLCRVPATQCIAQGELRTWFRTNNNARAMRLMFRNQAALDSATNENTYAVKFESLQVSYERWVAGAGTIIGGVAGFIEDDIWYHLRIIYWSGVDLEGTPALNIELYREVDAAWVKQGDTIFDTQDKWKDSEINRSGLHADTYRDRIFYWDDTEIWGAV